MPRARADQSRDVGDLRLSFPAVPESVPALRAAIARFAQEQGFSQRSLEAIQLAVSEAASKVVLHAYRLMDQPATIGVSAACRDNVLMVTVSDAGSGLRPHPDSPGLGVGLLLISTVADAVEFGRSPAGGLSVQMRFKAQAAESGLQSGC